MNTTIRFIALSLIATAANMASAASVPLFTGDGLRDEMLVSQAANSKAKAPAMPMQNAQAMTTTASVLQYQISGDALTDEKLFAQQAHARRHMAVGKGTMATLKDTTSRQ